MLTDHVRTMLDVPVAIISIVDADRQVFAGHCGLPEPWASRGETPMTHSFCQHVVETNDIFSVSDATIHDLVRENLAIGDLGVVAYLGVPVALPTGEIAGALAAIDTQPRDWSAHDLACLKSLAKVVEREISIFLSEVRYRRFFEDMQEGYYVARAIRSNSGQLTDVEFEEINPAFERLTGFSAVAVVGTRLSDLVPEALPQMLPPYDRVLTTGEVVEHENTVSALGGRWFENRIRKLDDDHIAALVTDVTARKRAEIELRESEIYWRGLFEQMSEGFILGTAIRDAEGGIIDWRYKKVNRAWGELLGMPVKNVAGRTIRGLFPDIEEAWITDIASVVDTGRPNIFVRQVGAIGRTYEGHVHPLNGDDFVILFLDVTERLSMEAALENRQKQLQTVIESMPVGVLLAEAPSGRIVMQNRRIVAMLGHDALIAQSRQEYGAFTAKHADGRAVHAEEYPLAIITSGRADEAYLEVRYVRPDGSEIWISIDGEAVKDTDGRLTGAVVAVADISDRKAEEEMQTVINREMSHRLKNTLAMVQAIATQTLRSVTDREPVDALINRIQALSSAHDILFDKYWNSAPIGRLIASTLHRVVSSERLVAEGPDITIGPKGALSLSLVLHELATNAVKYGALSNTTGHVELRWFVGGTEPDAEFKLVWREIGGPPAQAPSRQGFGSKLIRMGLIGTGGVETSYHDTGFCAEMKARLTQLQHTE
ncbi:PAS domain S-box protein [Oryzifoliimicrobium ureilyticus]|uniref:PAS domain S-box protein n=1 Tax=Oryzifoliimicrobium ureilyticus TaxID=3113724 RepID=UPI0030764F3D